MAATPIKHLTRDELSPEHQGMWDTMNRLTGDPTAIEVLAHSPVATNWYFHDFYAQMFNNQRAGLQVDVRTKHLLRLRYSKQHGCALCNRGNEEQARALEYFTDAQIDALLEPQPAAGLFTEAEHAVIEFADQMMLHNMDGLMTQARYERLRRHFTDAQIVEMAMVSAVLVGAAKMMFVLDIVPHEAVCPFPAGEAMAHAAE